MPLSSAGPPESSRRSTSGRWFANWFAPRAGDPPFYYAVAFAAFTVALASVVRWLMDPLAGAHIPYVVYIAAVALSTRRGGYVSGACAIVLSLLLGTYLFAAPRHTLWALSTDHLVAALVFTITSAIVIAALEAETRARRKVEHSERLLQQEYFERRRLERELEQAQRLESLGRLAGGVAHDFNNLLTVVAGSAEMLHAQLPKNVLVESILAASRRSAELTKELLGMGRRQMMDVRPMCINAAVEACLTLSARLLPEDIELSTDLAPELWWVEADPTGIDQVLLNLITNARDALPNGGSIRVATENVTLDERFIVDHPTMQPGDYVLLSVSDSGAGMNEEVLRHIFEPFFTTKAQGKGTGLGLPVAFGVVKQLRGHILVETAPGQGSVFKVYLPRTTTLGIAHEAPSRVVAAPIGERVSVLLVEDHELVRDMVAGMLRELGHHVNVACDGEAALAFAAQHPDLQVLLTDVVMPRMNGPQLAERLLQERPDMAIVYMSGYAENIILQKGPLRSGLLLKKPFSRGELELMLQRAMADRPRAALAN
jgi:signal transduction histidine kinase/CheY-like chemotaxis protein